ncbi:conserved protein of unknown function [Acidithiobacillus ferrivorans]|uniref:Uncharacterized protein n=1 Tax=Acidithiobacillus ferrivorans TaxID=160808 RepID=A0A060USS4_9PROT|nr:conserved hypothetical protein [Acidithiobacillus ferrivorans]SMH67146.1 conserved protein of unknown function [Acidithiobacillus ferrivorans]
METSLIFSRMIQSSDLFAGGAQLSQNDVNPFLVNGPDTLRAYPHTHPAGFALHPETVVLQIRQETTAGLIVGVGDIIPRHGLLACHLAYSGHLVISLKKGALYTIHESSLPVGGRHCLQSLSPVIYPYYEKTPINYQRTPLCQRTHPPRASRRVHPNGHLGPLPAPARPRLRLCLRR